MNVRPWARFDSTLEVDFVEDDDGNVLQYPGRIVSRAIGDVLKGLGCQVYAPDCAGDLGWEFTFQSGRGDLFCTVSFRDERWLLHCRCTPTILLGASRTSKRALVDILPRLNVALQADPRFSNLRWYTGDELHSGFAGAMEPIEPA